MSEPLSIIFDGNYQLSRILHIDSFNNMSYNNLFTGGIFGVLKIIKNVLSKFNPGRAILVWDSAHSERRLSIYSDYKKKVVDPAKKEEKELYYKKLNLSKHLLNSILISSGMHILEYPGKECDDVIYLLATKVLSSECILASDDKDYYQIISDRISVYRPMEDNLISIDNFEEVVGTSLDWFLFFKACNGDGSDNISSIEGVGAKTIKLLVEDYRLKVSSNYPKDNPSLVLNYAKTSSNKRINKIYASKDIVLRNLELMDLSKEDFHDLAISALKSKLSIHSNYDERQLLSKLTDYGMFSLVSNYSEFSSCFQKLV